MNFIVGNVLLEMLEKDFSYEEIEAPTPAQFQAFCIDWLDRTETYLLSHFINREMTEKYF